MGNNFSKLLLILNGAIGVGALIALGAPQLVSLGLWLGILPGLILGAMPTLFLYLFPFSVCWWKIRPKGVGFAVAGGVACWWLIGVLLPEGLNGRTMAALAETKARNREPGVSFGRVSTLALESTSPWSGTVCGDLCLVLLYNWEVERVLVLPSPPTPETRKDKAAQPKLYRIEKHGPCATVEQGRWNLGETWLPSLQQNELRKVILSRMADGECLVGEEGSGVKPEATIRWVRDSVREIPGLRLRPQPVRAEGLEIDSGGKPYLVRLQAWAPLLTVPLTLEPAGGGMEFNSWKMSTKGRAESPVPLEKWLGEVTGFDLEMPLRAPASSLRKQIDAVLADASLPGKHPAFSLLPDYLEELRQHRPEPGDAERLARLLSDERVESPGLVGKAILEKPELAVSAKEAILNRLVAMGKVERNYKYRELEGIVGRLPAGALAGEDPRVDAILADPEKRKHSPHLVYRLADRGPRSAAIFLDSLREAGRRAGPGMPVEWGEDKRAAMRGLCALGASASGALPELRRMEASGEIPKFVRTEDLWGAMLVALGADVRTVLPEKKEQYRKSYEEWVARVVKNRCAME